MNALDKWVSTIFIASFLIGGSLIILFPSELNNKTYAIVMFSEMVIGILLSLLFNNPHDKE